LLCSAACVVRRSSEDAAFLAWHPAPAIAAGVKLEAAFSEFPRLKLLRQEGWKLGKEDIPERDLDDARLHTVATGLVYAPA
jgi:hypothetical protein